MLLFASQHSWCFSWRSYFLLCFPPPTLCSYWNLCPLKLFYGLYEQCFYLVIVASDVIRSSTSSHLPIQNLICSLYLFALVVMLSVSYISRIYWCSVIFLLSKVQFRIASMDANFIPVNRVVCFLFVCLFWPRRILWYCVMTGWNPSSELCKLVWVLPSSQWIWRARSILVQESGRLKEGCLLILKTAWVWSAVWSSVINMLSEFIWHTLHLTQTSESIWAHGFFRVASLKAPGIEVNM